VKCGQLRAGRVTGQDSETASVPSLYDIGHPQNHARRCLVQAFHDLPVWYSPAMKLHLCVAGTLLIAATLFLPLVSGQEIDGSEIDKQLVGREQMINKLTIEDQLKLRAAQQKAVEDPAVKEALAKRNQAIEEFRKAVHDAMVKADPKMEAILQKIAVGNAPGF